MPSLHWVLPSRGRGAGTHRACLSCQQCLQHCAHAFKPIGCCCLPACSALLLFLLCSSAANGVVKPGAVRMPGTVEAKSFHIKPQAPKPAYLAVSRVASLPAECLSLGGRSLSPCSAWQAGGGVAQRHAGCLSWMHDSLCSSRSVPSQNACGSLLRVQKLQTASGHQPACARRMHDLLGPLQVGTAAPQAPAAPQAAAAGGSDKPPSLMIFVTRMFEKIGQEPEHVKQRAQVDLLILQSALLLPTALASTAGRTDCAVHVAPAEGAQFLGCFPHVLKAACLSTMLLCVSAMLNTKLLQLKLREMIEDATSKGELWTRQWDKVPLDAVFGEAPPVNAVVAAAQAAAARLNAGRQRASTWLPPGGPAACSDRAACSGERSLPSVA